MITECLLTTIDNPFNPFEDFDEWFNFDVEKGYYSCSKLARIAEITPEMTEKEINEEMERAIDVIIKNDFLDIYRKVTHETNELITIAT